MADWLMPSLMINQLRYISLINPIMTRQFVLSESIRVVGPDFLHLFIGHFPALICGFLEKVRMKLCPVASLIRHIFVVFSYRTKKQMIWIYTGRIIAFVANTTSFWNQPKCNLISYTMGTNNFAVIANTAITPRIDMLKPNPTLFWSSKFDFRPESLFNGIGLRPLFLFPI